MTDQPQPGWFNSAIYVAVAWNLLGLIQYIVHVSITPDTLAAMSSAERDLIMSMPSWATAAFALAVSAGFIGSALLLLKKAWALQLFLLSTIAVLVQNYYAFFMSKSVEVYGPVVYALPTVVLIVNLLLIWMCVNGKKQGWLS